MGERERWASWHLVAPGGRRAAGGPGLAALAAALGRPRLARGLRLLPLAAGYAAVASLRHQLGRLVPDRPGPRRFP